MELIKLTRKFIYKSYRQQYSYYENNDNVINISDKKGGEFIDYISEEDFEKILKNPQEKFLVYNNFKQVNDFFKKKYVILNELIAEYSNTKDIQKVAIKPTQLTQIHKTGNTFNFYIENNTRSFVSRFTEFEDEVDVFEFIFNNDLKYNFNRNLITIK